jgi:hypothetical protein
VDYALRRYNQRCQVNEFFEAAMFSDVSFRELYQVFVRDFGSEKVAFRRFVRLGLDTMRQDPRYLQSLNGCRFSKKYCREKGIVVVRKKL